MADITSLLPPSLNLPPHLSAHKYFFVCTLTVAAWDTLVLSPRGWRLMKTKEWPFLKVIFHFLRVFMPVVFVIVAVAFFDTAWTQSQCQRFFLFEPICTAILMAANSIVHVIRVHAIYDKNRTILGGLGGLFAVQVVVMAVCCGFYRSVPLDVGQGCIAGPKSNWVGIYWLAPTLLYTASFGLAVKRSLQSLQVKPLSPWKLMLRDGLNLYGAIWIVNMVNMLFWFIAKPTGIEDTIKTIVTSMAAVLTTTMTLRIILSVRGTLSHGGSFAGSTTGASSHTGASGGSRGTTHVISTRANGQPTPGVLQLNSQAQRNQTFSISDAALGDDKRGVVGGDWDNDGKSSVDGRDAKEAAFVAADKSEDDITQQNYSPNGVKITIDRHVN